MPKAGSDKTKPPVERRSECTSLPPASISLTASFVPEVELVALSEVKPNPKNARTHPSKQIRNLKANIKSNGFTNPLLLDENNVLLAGHGRLRAAQLAGLDKVPIIRIRHLSPTQKRAYLIADNKLAEASGWDRDLLTPELLELVDLLPLENLDLALTGFEAAEIDLLAADLAPAMAEVSDELPPVPTTPVARLGDLWRLGKHRLLCGDARETDHLLRLMDGRTAAAVFCDPPYNVRISSVVGRGRTKHSEFICASGEMPEPQFASFLTTTLANAIRVSAPGAIHFACMDWRHVDILLRVGKELYGATLNLVVWNKTNAGQGSYYRSQHELVGVFRVGNAPHRNNIELGKFGRNRSNVWTYPGVNTFGRGRMDALTSHPTVKPVAMVADALLDCTARGDCVLDHFAGSGTILLAAEKVGRIGHALEYDPRYVDVAIKRWESATKLDATLESDGRTFEQVSTARLSEGAPSREPSLTR